MSMLPVPPAAPQIGIPQPPEPQLTSIPALPMPASQSHTSSHYIPEPPRQPSRFWRAVKWPLRQLFKAIILTGRAIKAHKAVALILLAVIVLVGGGTYGLYHVTHPSAGAAGGQSGAASSARTVPETPFTITLSGAPSYPARAVVNGLYAFKSYDASRLWNSFSPSFQRYSTQAGNTEQTYQQNLDSFKAQGIVFDDFIVTGEYLGPDGYAYYTVELIYHQGQQGGLATLYFALDPTGAISNFQFLHEQPAASSSGQ